MGRRGRNGKIPDRWMDYAPMKGVISDVKIIPFKVPLPFTAFDNDSMMKHKWTPSDVMRNVPDLGLVIDLTFKFPCYYEPIEFLENGVDYVKIGTPGHVIPPEETFLKFCDTIENFHKEHPDLLVGVHCTHGVNRTGYMICRYMVEKCGFTADKAFSLFAEMRGYEVERENYIKRIRDIVPRSSAPKVL